MNVFFVEPTFVIVPVKWYFAPSFSANPNLLVTVTVSFVNALPSYTFSSFALVNETLRFVI